jgi:hypothetical protein
LSFYAWKINRDWQKGNQDYLRQLSLGPDSRRAAAFSLPQSGWTDAARRPAVAANG